MTGILCLCNASAFPLTDSNPDSPAFRKRFMASYGVNADIEPTLSQKDRPLYESIAPHLENDPRYAIQQVEQQITRDSNAAFDFLLGNLYYSIEDFAAAKRHLQNAVKKFPTFRRAYRTLALIEVQQSRFTASVPLWRKVITLGGGDAQSYGLLAYAYLLEEKYASAATAYDMARMFAPDSHDYKRGKAQCLFMTENYTAAIALFDELISESPDQQDYWMFQANAFIAQERYNQAIANLEIAHELGTPTWESLILLGDLYLSQNTYPLAIAAYQKALNAHPTTPPDKALLPLQSLLKLKHYAEAKAYVQTLDQTLQSELTPEQQIEYSLMQAEIELGLGAAESARVRLTDILNREPLNGHALVLLGNLEKNQGNFAKAELHLERATHLAAVQVQAWESLGQLAIKRRDFKQAIQSFEQAYKLKPSPQLKDYIEKLTSMESLPQ